MKSLVARTAALFVAFITDPSLIKGLTWRLIASCETCFLAYLVTGSVEAGLKIMSIEMVSKVVLYWLHDKAWLAAPGMLERMARRRRAIVQPLVIANCSSLNITSCPGVRIV